MKMRKSVTGILSVELTSAEPENALTSINEAGIEIQNVQQIGELSIQFQICGRDFAKLEVLCSKRGEKLRILRKTGLYWTIKNLASRPVALVGVMCLLAFVFFFPTRVYFVQVDGNTKIPSNQILEAAEACGIGFGASRREVRSEKVKNALLSAVPELQWAGVNTSGCVATISVRERADREPRNGENAVSNIVAARDGYILSGTVTSGNAVFQIGQTVKAGQILISGYMDCGICVRAMRSEGEIFAQTHRTLEVITPSVYSQRMDCQGVKRKISLLCRKKRINLWKDSGISDVSCGRMYKEYYISLPGGFQLPIALCVETYAVYDVQFREIPREDVKSRLAEFADDYLKRQMVAGEILEKTQHVSIDEERYCLTGKYICKEMIGREQREQIGETNGKSS